MRRDYDLELEIMLLPPKFRGAVELLLIGYDVPEVAEMLDVTPADVYARLGAIRSSVIRRHLARLEIEELPFKALSG